MKSQATAKTAIQTAAINRCTDKATGETFYTVKSDSQADTWYTVRWDQDALTWRCNCPAHKPCKHERAVTEVLKARHEQEKEASRVEASPVVASEPRRNYAPLNGNKGFSLMR